jgi:hypothetical protein
LALLITLAAFFTQLTLGSIPEHRIGTVKISGLGGSAGPSPILQRSPNILLIPGTSSLEHLRENLKAAGLKLPGEVTANLDSIGGGSGQRA